MCRNKYLVEYVLSSLTVLTTAVVTDILSLMQVDMQE